MKPPRTQLRRRCQVLLSVVFSLIKASNRRSASPVFMNPTNFLTSPVSPWDELLTMPALDADVGMTPHIYTSPIMDFGEDFDMPSLFGSSA